MLSPALSQLLERARLRFGLEVEILDAGLKSLYPESDTDLARLVEESPAVRRALLDAMAAGRPQRLEDGGGQYRVFPLRRAAGRRHADGLLAIRRRTADALPAGETEPWADLARAIVEADLEATEALHDERQRSRRLSGALRFIELIADPGASGDAASVGEALVQAAAVWYDVDARIYRRNLAGDFILHTWLPGVEPVRRGAVLAPHLVGGHPDIRRVTATTDLADAVASHEMLLVPLAFGDRVEWVMTFAGSVPVDAEPVLRLVARVAGERLAWLSLHRQALARDRFEAIIAQATRVPELVAVRVMQELAQAVASASVALTLTTDGRTRRIAAVGSPGGDVEGQAESETIVAAERIVHAMTFGDDRHAALELRPLRGESFTAEGAAIANACAGVLRTWLAGALSSFEVASTWLDPLSASTSAFSARIQEELERAKRLNLRLSLILIDVTATADAMTQLQTALRQELRGSDVTGAMSGNQVAALLTHTDALGLDNVVRRLKDRLADAAEALNLSDVRLGQAALSPECPTAGALLELALRQAEPVIVH